MKNVRELFCRLKNGYEAKKDGMKSEREKYRGRRKKEEEKEEGQKRRMNRAR